MAGLRDTWQNKMGQFAKLAKKSEDAPIVAVLSSELTHNKNLTVDSVSPSPNDY
jgi:hypothetical protein